MIPTSESTARLKALEGLMDDPTPAVRNAVVDEIIKYGSAGRAFLNNICKGNDLELRRHALSILMVLDKDSPQKLFSRFIKSLNYELESGYFLLSRIDNPELKVSDLMARMDDIALRCQTLFTAPLSPRDRCRILNRVIFHEYGFTGNRSDFNNPNNTFIHSLFETRKGLPISLAMLYLMVGRRLELDLEPVAIPGRFMVGCFLEKEPFFIDVYENGIFRSLEDLLYFLEANELDANLGHFGPCPIGEVLCRCCRNLSQQYRLLFDDEKADLYQSYVEEFESHF
ncbi:MAG: transglutaminase-like domain-containing protein [Verrucomicrobia bacterium]|nr:transglutaminase-like domain-containing protein [Verrucomicrobiota bacterium]MDA1067408.1 transglutaminase-like domain-containing protein [Verrucomicrobiota bacterium]